jgi:hypothetical protein
MQTRYEPRARSQKIKLCLREKALLQADEREKRPFCVPERNENILLPNPGIYPLASSKKYFRDPAKHTAGLPISGIFATDSHPQRHRRPHPLALPCCSTGVNAACPPRPKSTADTPCPVTIRAVFRPQRSGKGWNEQGLPMLVRIDAASRTSRFSRDHGIF